MLPGMWLDGRGPLDLVVRSSAGEDLDFDERFRRARLKRWIRGVRNGMSLRSLLAYRLGLSTAFRLCDVVVGADDDQVTCRLIEDIWMRGEYDLPGYIPESGWRVVDIGANVGVFAMLAASRGARVICYEPTPETHHRLQANTATLSVECVNAGVVGRSEGTALLFAHRDRHTRNTFRPGGSDGPAESFHRPIDVPVVSIAEALTEPCDLLKLDCEGCEFEIFETAGDSLRNAARVIAELDGGAGDVDKAAANVRAAGFAVEVHETNPGMQLVLLAATRY
jgi:FkbM family methyltransferase